MSNTTYSMQARDLLALDAFRADAKDSRFMLMGIQFKRDKATATNGPVLLQLGVAGSDDAGEMICGVPAELVKLCKLKKNRECEVRVTDCGNGSCDWVIDTPDSMVSFSAKLIEASYPDVERVIPKVPDTITMKSADVPAFDGRYVVLMGSTAEILTDGKCPAMRVTYIDATGPTLVTFPLRESPALAVIMPVRT